MPMPQMRRPEAAKFQHSGERSNSPVQVRFKLEAGSSAIGGSLTCCLLTTSKNCGRPCVPWS